MFNLWKREGKIEHPTVWTIPQVPVALKRLRSLSRMNNFSSGEAHQIDWATDFPNPREFP